MEKYKLSIIIPMYNCEKYIAECLDSILNSDLPRKEYEVVLVDDGSKDEGPQIVQFYMSKHHNIRYLLQENQGQSVARNLGIKNAKGEYLWFVDADDKVDPHETVNAYSKLLENIGIDVIAFQLKCISETGSFLSYVGEHHSVKHEVVIKGRDAILTGYSPSSVCALFIRKGLLNDNNLYFKPGITQQDVELSYRLFAYANNVLFLFLKPYFYIQHQNSCRKPLDAQRKLKYELDKIEIIKSFKNLSAGFRKSDFELSSKISEYSDSALFGCVVNLYKHRREWRQLGINRAVICELKKNNLYPLHIISKSWKKRLIIYVLNHESVLY